MTEFNTKDSRANFQKQEDVTINKSEINNTDNKSSNLKAEHLRKITVYRAGTFTTGVSLILTGALLFASFMYPHLSVVHLFRFSPLLLCLLGAEILFCSARAKNNAIRYDISGVLLCSVVVIFAVLLASSYVFSGIAHEYADYYFTFNAVPKV